MLLDKCVLLCALLVLSVIVDPINAKRSGFGGSRSGSHSYPRSGGLSGGSHSSGGSPGYPSSGGLSGGNHGYPSSGGLSGTAQGTNSHGYPPARNNQGYPPSGGLSGSGSNTHHSNSHGYPAGSGLAGKAPVTNVHHHYHYSNPQSISYAPTRGGAPVHYPVYQGQPPTYVYKYKDSGSKYGTLLAGLALLNLGALGATAYAASHSHSNYKPQPGEFCKFGVKKDNGDYEETKIDCQLITSFIFPDQQSNSQTGAKNTTITTTTVTNTTIVNATNEAPVVATVNQTAPVVNPLYEMLPNGTLVPVNITLTNDTVTTTGAPVENNNSLASVVVTTTTTNTTVVNALDVKGKDVEVTPGMQCFVIRQTSSSKMKKTVPCGLLQSYATQSLKRNSAGRNVPALTILAAVLAAFVMY